MIGQMNRIYSFHTTDQERDYEEAKKDAISVAEKLPALAEVIKFIFDGCHGLKPEISEQKIDDAFDCMMDRDKVFIKTSKLSKEDKEKAIRNSETEWHLRKTAFKSSLEVKVRAN